MKRKPKQPDIKLPKPAKPPGTGNAWKQTGLIFLACLVAAGAGLLITQQFIDVFTGSWTMNLNQLSHISMYAASLVYIGAMLRFRGKISFFAYVLILVGFLIVPAAAKVYDGDIISPILIEASKVQTNSGGDVLQISQLDRNFRAFTFATPAFALIVLLMLRRRRRDRTLVKTVHVLSLISLTGYIVTAFLYLQWPENRELAYVFNISAIIPISLMSLTAIFRALQKQTKVDVAQITDDETFDIPGCLICAGVGGDERMMRVEVWADDYWRLTASLVSEVPGFCYLEPRRHIEDITQLNGVESQIFGATLARITDALKEATGADQIYIYVFGDTIPHLHLHLAPHRDGDALNDDMVKGEKTIVTLESGLEMSTSKDHPLLPEKQLRATAKRIQAELGG